ncbi:MAG: NADP-dependent phosphogluconate dehydrogenase [Polyangiaceae bacterium]
MSEMQIGMVGLGVMGQNLALNIDEKGFSCAGWDAWPEPVDKFDAKAKKEGAKAVKGFKDLKEFVASLRRPRRIILLVKAGEVVDKTIAGLLPLLEKDDMIVDAGNEFFHNTERRFAELAPKGIRFFGMGVSGGEEGARHGPSMMPGGDRAGYDDMAPILTKIAAQVDGPCVTYCGPGGAGHYVKMVHNGIEYGDMQLIAEAYDCLKSLGGLSNAELADTFSEWNRGELQSFLIEITANIFRKKDPETGKDLVDMIVDAAAAKGTGKWTVQDAAEIGAPVPTIASSVEARLISSERAARLTMAKTLSGPVPSKGSADKKKLVADVRAALYAAKACSYAQGMNLLRAASNLRKWGINLGELARIWKGGCIIRAQFLGRIKEAYDRDPNLVNLLMDPGFQKEIADRQSGWRSTVAQAIAAGVPLMTMGGSLGYYDSIRRERLPANLTQAQRDYFGAHTYQRLDKEGTFHTEWLA